jgi:hypothetical protein
MCNQFVQNFTKPQVLMSDVPLENIIHSYNYLSIVTQIHPRDRE